MARKKNFTTVAEALRSVERSSARKERAREKREAELAARIPGGGYEPCIVSFIDVLGFRNLLETRHADDIRDVLLQLRQFTAPDEERPARPVKDARRLSRAFAESVSDAVVRVRVFDTHYNDGAFFHELLDLLHAQINCIQHGVVIRAGIAIGDAHVGLDGKGPIFGPAMVRAYEVETNDAIYPRIIVDDDAYKCFLADARLRKQDHSINEELRHVGKLLRKDVNGTRFIDYLRASEPEFDEPAEYFHFLRIHAELIRGKLTTTTDRVREKFEWLATYHNSVVDNLRAQFASRRRSSQSFLEESGLTTETFLESITITL